MPRANSQSIGLCPALYGGPDSAKILGGANSVKQVMMGCRTKTVVVSLTETILLCSTSGIAGPPVHMLG